MTWVLPLRMYILSLLFDLQPHPSNNSSNNSNNFLHPCLHQGCGVCSEGDLSLSHPRVGEGRHTVQGGRNGLWLRLFPPECDAW